MKYLNLGCGKRFHPDWVNVNFTETGSGVIAHDLTQGIPFKDSSFKVVYHSHLLEHLQKSQAPLFLRECYRVLQPEGILRVVVPDLENIAQNYILQLGCALDSDDRASCNYDWLLLELLDQMVRQKSGGEMAQYLFQKEIPNQDYIVQRIGEEARHLIELGQTQQHQKSQRLSTPVVSSHSGVRGKLRAIYRFLRDSEYRHQRLLQWVLSPAEFHALEIGRFRQSGEVHQWMYDRYSLAVLMQQCGFERVQRCSADESAVPEWRHFHLDTAPDGSIHKPDSLFMEAIKPATIDATDSQTQ